MLYNKSMIKNLKISTIKISPKVTLSFIILFVSICNFSFAQNNINTNANNIYAPNTRNLNIVDTLALHTYCKLSKIFTKELSREKCFTSNRQSTAPVSTISFIDPNAPTNNNQNENLLKSEEIKKLENKLSFYDDEIKNLKKDIENTKNNQIDNANSGVTKVINNTIIRYVNNKPVQNNDTVIVDTKANSIAAGMFNTVLSEYAYVYGYNNTVEAFTPNTLTLGSNIRNNKANSVQIGLSNSGKLTILDKTNGNKNNGWIGTAGRVDPLNSDPCAASSTTTCASPELLRVPGKIVAKAFEVNGAADLAEKFPVEDESITAGDIVEFGDKTYAWSTGGNENTSGEYQVSGVIKAKTSKKAIGVVSTNPGFILGGETLKSVPIAFSGRVPVKVTEENGKILKGDKVKVSITQNGYGAKSISDGYVIGTALSDAKDGKVLILVKNEYVSNLNLSN